MHIIYQALMNSPFRVLLLFGRSLNSEPSLLAVSGQGANHSAILEDKNYNFDDERNLTHWPRTAFCTYKLHGQYWFMNLIVKMLEIFFLEI